MLTGRGSQPPRRSRLSRGSRLSPGSRLSRRSRRPRWAGMLAFTAVAALTLLAVGVGPARADGVRNAQSWVLSAIGAPAAWQTTQGQGVTVAVIDSGVNPQVSDLTGSVTTGPDYTGVSTPSSDAEWGVHGTWMASLIAGHGHDGGDTGILGVAPRARVLSLRVITDSTDPGASRYEHEPQTQIQNELAQAISYAVSHGAGVISMSLGYGMPSLPVRSALQNALNRDVVVVASSGNSGDTASTTGQTHAPYSFPADYPGVLGVAALGQGGAPADFSSNNLSVQVAAPGVDVPAQGRDDQYWLVSGTSPACALAAGVAALIKSADPGLSAALVRQAITSTTTNRPAGGYNEQVGFGTVDATAALTAAAHLSAGGIVGPGAPARGRAAASSAAPLQISTPAAVASSSPANGAGALTPASNISPLSAGITAASHFGGGPAAVPPPPVPPRGLRPLVLFSALAAACLAVIVTTMSRLVAARRPSVARAAGPGSTGDHQAGAVPAPAEDGVKPPPGPGLDAGTRPPVRRSQGSGFAAPRYPWSASPPGRHALPPKKTGTPRQPQ
jgi:subtilisin family serine protease